MSAMVRIPVGVVVERLKAESAWIDFIWRPSAVLPGEPAARPWTMLSEALRKRIVGLYRLTFRDLSGVIETARGGPVYLILAAGADMVLRFKPQNLVTGLPLKPTRE